MNKSKNFLLYGIIVLLIGCNIDKSDDTEPWQENIVKDLTRKEWVRNYHVVLADKEYDEQEIRKFNNNATGYWKTIATFKNGEKSEYSGNFKWTFTTLAYEIIYMDSPSYWEIEEFTSEKLRVFETYVNPLEPQGREHREYKEFTIKK